MSCLLEFGGTGGGGGTPGGSSGAVQFNNAGSFGGVTNLTSNGTNPLLTAIVAPAAPAAGFGVFYEDSTNLILSFKNAAGTVSSTVVPATAPANQFATGISAAGAIAFTQPTIGNLANIANNTIVGNNAGSAGPPLALTGAQAAAIIGGLTGSAVAGQVTFWNTATTVAGDVGMTYVAGGQLTLALGTITTNLKALNITGTWNLNTTTFDAPVFVNITNTASAAASAIVDVQVGGVTIFNIQPTASVAGGVQAQIGTGSTTSQGWIFGTDASGFSGIWTTGITPSGTNYSFLAGGSNSYVNAAVTSSTVNLRVANSDRFVVGNSQISVEVDNTVWGSTLNLQLSRMAAGTLGILNSPATSAAVLQVYNTSDVNSGAPTNYERGVIDWTTNANVCTIATQQGGTGAQRELRLQGGIGGGPSFWANGAVAALNTTGAFANCFTLAPASGLTWVSGTVGTLVPLSGTQDLSLYHVSSGVLLLGNGATGDVNAPSALGLKLQSANAGTAVNVGGATFTETASLSTGGGLAGTWIQAAGFTGTGAAGTATISNASPAVITIAAHNYFIGEPFTLTTTGTLPTGFSTLTTYYIISAGFGAGAFEASTTFGGAAVNTSTAGSGTHTVNPGGVCTISNASPAVITLNNHGLVPGMQVQFATTGALPTGLATATTYFVLAAGLTINAFEVSATLNGAAINTSSAGSGTQTVLYQGGTTQNPAYTVATWGPSQLTGVQGIANPALSIAQLFNVSGNIGTTQFIVGNQQMLFGNGTLASGLKIYNTVDNIASPTNYERGIFDWTTNANVLKIGTQAGGTGTARDVRLMSASFVCGVGAANAAFPFAAAYGGGVNQNQWQLGANIPLSWNSNSTAGASNADTGCTRSAAQVIAINSGDPASLQAATGWINWGGEARLDADFSATSNTTLANVTGTTHSLTVSLQAGRNYIFDICLEMVTGASAGGIKIGIGGTATVTNLIADGFCHDGTTIVAVTRVSASPGTLVANTNAGTAPVARFQGTFECNAAGTFTVQFAQNASNATASTVKRGSYMKVHDAP